MQWNMLWKSQNWESKFENQKSDSYCTYVITSKEEFDHDLNENEYMMRLLKKKIYYMLKSKWYILNIDHLH